MRFPAAALLLLLAVPLSGQQRPAPTTPGMRVDLRQVRLGTDTLELQVAADTSLRFTMTESLTRGSGPDAGRLRLVQTITGAAMNNLANIDTVIADAATLAFQRSVDVRLGEHGRVLYRATETVAGGELVTDEPSDTGRVISRARLAPGSTLLAMPNLVMRTAPLSRDWHPSLTFRIPSAGRPLTISVDSVTTGVAAGRRSWLVHANPGDGSRLQYAVDSQTRDLIEFVVRDSAGGVVSTVKNLRYHVQPAPKTTPPGKAGAQLVSGHYYLEGVREVGSELVLQPDGRFQYMLAYGAVDETSEGTWRVHDGSVVLQTDGAPHPPSVMLASSRGKARDSITVFVSDAQGRPLSGVEIDFVSAGGGMKYEHTRNGRFTHRFAATDMPAEIAVGYDVLNFMRNFPLTRPPAAEYRFTFDRGDLGTRRFDAERLTIEGDVLVMMRQGRRMRYVRH